MVHKAAAVSPKETRSSVEKGDQFEKEVADVFRSIPHASVRNHVKIGGKDVDIYVVLKGNLFGTTRIAVDAKDYSRRISRERAAEEYHSYYPLIANGDVDQFMLVTRHGIVANANEIFDSKKSVHHTISELQNLVVDPTQLVSEMEGQFSTDQLNKYYVSTKCYELDLETSYKNYDLYYNDLIALCLSRGIRELDEAKRAWRSRTAHRSSLPNRYTVESFQNALSCRRKSNKTINLEPLVEKWLISKSLNVGLALLGTYGTGKSSFARRVAFSAAQRFRAGKSSRIPLLIELRNFGSHQSIEGLITHTLVNKYGYVNGSFSLFRRMNASGRYFLILDGFDEMKQGMTKDALAYNFSELNSLCEGESRVLLCGRPTMFESEEEQTAILSGGLTTGASTQARYIPIEIAPLEQHATFQMIMQYVQVKEPQEADVLISKISHVRAAVKANRELANLLSRPVHIPMFVTILPEFEGDVSLLNRGYLYETFIKKIILREVLRLTPAYQHRYSSEQRFLFSGYLALEMAKLGEVRSIRRSEIPSSIISPFVHEGETIETARQDLVTACFLEQKPPDILSFGHKSFLEFLAAWYQLGILRRSVPGSLNDIIYPTNEIASFVVDLLGEEDLGNVLQDASPISREFIIACVLQSVSNIFVRHFAKPPRGKVKETDRPFIRIAIFTREREGAILDYFTSPEFISKLAKVEWTSEAKHKLAVIIALGAFAERAPRYALPANIGTLGSRLRQYDVETWNDIFSLAGGSAGLDLVTRLFYDHSSLSHTAIRAEFGLGPRESHPKLIDDRLLIDNYNRVFSYDRALSVISEKVRLVHPGDGTPAAV